MTAATAGPRSTTLDAETLASLPLPQRKRLAAMARTCANLTIGKRLKDGAIMLTGIPGWEQGRWATDPATGNRIFTKGYGRSCSWALAPDGTLFGHGWGKEMPATYAAAGASLLPAPTQGEREKLAQTRGAASPAIRLQGTIRRAAERKARRQTHKPGATTANRAADAAAIAAQPPADTTA